MLMSRKEFFEKSGKAVLAAGALGAGMSTLGATGCTSSSGSFTLTYKTIRLQLQHAWTLSRNTSTYKDNVFVKLEKDGIFGLGEAAHNVRYGETLESTIQTIELARPILESCNPWTFVDVGEAIQKVCEGQTAAKAAMDMALMEWIAKKLGLPFYRFLGLDPKKAPGTTFSIGIDTPEVIKQKVREAEPYPLLKAKMGGPNDEEILAAIRSVTDKPLRVDANEGWKDKEVAIRKIEWLAKNGVEIVEQPMPSNMLEETAWVRERSPLPIIADESVKSAHDIPALAQAFDGINIKVDKAGGLQEALRMIWMARSLRMKIMLGCMIASSLSITAAAHLSPLVDYPDLDGNLLIANDPFQGVRVKDGWLILPDGPGFGVKGVF
ncbi:MAG: dipeptide epimerase [bacterium]|jgi:L-alanine-DL-glutamate epimerase-like enolase superfamily enzyme|nr:dipeptide epimerase [candidate division KSB1 bacterium]MDH7560706.1 dipeptide epimerase [bacterium]